MEKVTINDNLLMDNIHIRLCALEEKFKIIEKKIDKYLKNRWVSIVETIILTIALIVTAVLTL